MKPLCLLLQLLCPSALANASFFKARRTSAVNAVGLSGVGWAHQRPTTPRAGSLAVSAGGWHQGNLVRDPALLAFNSRMQRRQQPTRRGVRAPASQQQRPVHADLHPATGVRQQHPFRPRPQQEQPWLGCVSRSLQQRVKDLGGKESVRPAFLSGVGSLQMNAIPHGSALERQLNELMEDPIKNMPWDIYVPFYKAYGRGTDNNWLHFLQGNWTFIESKSFAEKPVGVIDGGPEAYEGGGTSLPFHPLSIDRQHAVKWPQHLAHGVGFREATDRPYNIRLDRLPDGNQDVYFGETDAELEARLWGSWDDPQGLHEYFPETGWRDTLPDDDITGMPRPWTHKQTDVLELPPHHRDPSPGPPEIPLEVELAAAGIWKGYVLEPGWTRHAEAIAECNKAAQWRAEEPPAAAPPRSKRLKTAASLSKKQEKQRAAELLRRTQDIVKAHWADIRKHPVYVRAVVDGATHEAAVAAAAAATPKTAAEMAMGKEITEGLEMQETEDPRLARGEVNPPDAAGKTMAVNLALYSLSPYSCSYLSPRASVAEHAELYHYLMTENHREGRYTDFHTDIAATMDKQYSLRHRRQHFPRLMSLYRPLWAQRKYGEEFGEPLDAEAVVDEALMDPAVSLQGGPPCRQVTCSPPASPAYSSPRAS